MSWPPKTWTEPPLVLHSLASILYLLTSAMTSFLRWLLIKVFFLIPYFHCVLCSFLKHKCNQVFAIYIRLTWSVVEWSGFVSWSFVRFGEISGKVMRNLFLWCSLSAGSKEASGVRRCRRTNINVTAHNVVLKVELPNGCFRLHTIRNWLYICLPFCHFLCTSGWVVLVEVVVTRVSSSVLLTALVPPSGHNFNLSNVCFIWYD